MLPNDVVSLVGWTYVFSIGLFLGGLYLLCIIHVNVTKSLNKNLTFLLDPLKPLFFFLFFLNK